MWKTCFGFLLIAATLHGESSPLTCQTDWKTAFRLAKEQHRMVFVEFTSGSCGECHDVEMITFQAPAVQQVLSEMVLLRLDVVLSRIPPEHRRADLPAYVVYDPAEHERFRVSGKGAGSFLTVMNLEEIRRAAPALVRAAELSDEMEADFLAGDAYSRLNMGRKAREAYAAARRLAERRGNAAAAQSAEIRSAATFTRQGDARASIKQLTALAGKAVNQENEAMIWLALCQAYKETKDDAKASEACGRAQALRP